MLCHVCHQIFSRCCEVQSPCPTNASALSGSPGGTPLLRNYHGVMASMSQPRWSNNFRCTRGRDAAFSRTLRFRDCIINSILSISRDLMSSVSRINSWNMYRMIAQTHGPHCNMMEMEICMEICTQPERWQWQRTNNQGFRLGMDKTCTLGMS
jgi:hypothetical protein